MLYNSSIEKSYIRKAVIATHAKATQTTYVKDATWDGRIVCQTLPRLKYGNHGPYMDSLKFLQKFRTFDAIVLVQKTNNNFKGIRKKKLIATTSIKE